MLIAYVTTGPLETPFTLFFSPYFYCLYQPTNSVCVDTEPSTWKIETEVSCHVSLCFYFPSLPTVLLKFSTSAMWLL